MLVKFGDRGSIPPQQGVLSIFSLRFVFIFYFMVVNKPPHIPIDVQGITPKLQTKHWQYF